MVQILKKTFIASLNRALRVTDVSVNRVKNLLIREENGIVNAAFILMVLVLITKVAGLLFNSMSAGFLGAGPYNEFLFASNIPEIISASILLGAISASIIPALVEAREEKGHSVFLNVFSTLVNTSLLLFSVIAIIIAVTAGELMPWMIEKVIRPVDPPSSEELSNIILMMRVLMIPQIILGISTYISSSLNVMQRFVVPQLAPLFYNFGRILAIIALVPVLGRSPWVLVWGTLLGAVFHLLIQLPLAIKLNIKYLPVIDLKNKYFHSVLKLGLPRIAGLSAEQIAYGADRFIAYGLIGYSLTAYELSIRLVVIPISLFGMTFATAAFPALSRAYIKHDMVRFKEVFLRVLNQIFFLALPVTSMLLVLRLPITRLFYGIFGGNFTWEYTKLVAWGVMFFALGITFEALRSFIYRTYYALHNSTIPLVSAIFVVIGGITTGILFTNYFSHFNDLSVFNLEWNPKYFLEKSDGLAGIGGLALSSSLIYTVEVIVLSLFLNFKYLKLKYSEMIFPISKKLFIALLTTIFAYFMYAFYNDILDTSKTWQIFFLTTSTVIAASSFYLLLSYEFKVKEVEIVDIIVDKFIYLFKKKNN